MTSLSQAGASDGVWLWQQYADGQYQDGGVSQSNAIQTQDGMIIYQINSNGEQQQLVGRDGRGRARARERFSAPARWLNRAGRRWTAARFTRRCCTRQTARRNKGWSSPTERSTCWEVPLPRDRRKFDVWRRNWNKRTAWSTSWNSRTIYIQNHWCQEQQIIAYTQIEGSTLENGTSVGWIIRSSETLLSYTQIFLWFFSSWNFFKHGGKFVWLEWLEIEKQGWKIQIWVWNT